jgi:hypothetical protein
MGFRPVAFLAAMVLAACDTMSNSERDILRADADAFELIARSEARDPAPDSAVTPGFLRIDARPVTDNALASTDGTSGLTLEDSTDRLRGNALSRLTEQRRAILSLLHLEEGGPFSFPMCGGTRTRRGIPATAASCPTDSHRYVTVGLPYRGVAEILYKLKRPDAPPPDSSGDVWTVVVNESSIGPGGQDWRQYAWLVRRDPIRHELALVERYLLSWAE